MVKAAVVKRKLKVKESIGGDNNLTQQIWPLFWLLSRLHPYFDMTRTPEQGIQITYREEAITQRLMEFGYFALLSWS
jgi:hypothetical protein